jgi:hypothetical protein
VRISRAAFACPASRITQAALALTLVALVAGPAAAVPPGVGRRDYVLYTSSSAAHSRSAYTPTAPGTERGSADVFLDRQTKLYEQFSCGPQLFGAPGVIRWSSSVDGKTWSPATVVLLPRSGTADGAGVCDPSVVRDGASYYMAFTGYDGHQHAVFVARATSLGGPWVTWGRTGWGVGDPAPVIKGTLGQGWGVGHPSLVVAGARLQLFYDDHDGRAWQTRLADADVSGDPDGWPAALRDLGVAMVHPGSDSADGCAGQAESTGVAYEDDIGQYVAVATDDRDTQTPSLDAYQSGTGLGFTRAITELDDDSSTPLPPHAHHLRLVTDDTGHVVTGPLGLTYDVGPRDCTYGIRWQDAGLWTDPTGWAGESLAMPAGLAHWETTGSWKEYPNAVGTTSDSGGLATAFLTSSTLGPTSTIDVDVELAGLFQSGYAGVAFGQTSSTLDGPHGYVLSVLSDSTLKLSRGSATVATGLATPTPIATFQHLEIVLSHGEISVYTGRTGFYNWNGMAAPAIRYTIPRGEQLSGEVGLVADGEAVFKSFTMRDNVPAQYPDQDGPTALDWRQVSGHWVVGSPSTITEDDSGGGDVFLNAHSDVAGDYNAHLGDGAYRAAIQVSPSKDPTAWDGIDITNDGPTGSLSCGGGGYVALIRENGAVGLSKAGVGQVVPDVPTGLDPVRTPVRLRVVRWGADIQVYLNDQALPVITYTDPAPADYSGGFGLCTHGVGGVFRDVGYAANGM